MNINFAKFTLLVIYNINLLCVFEKENKKNRTLLTDVYRFCLKGFIHCKIFI